jgi:hypothetical protein
VRWCKTVEFVLSERWEVLRHLFGCYKKLLAKGKCNTL